MKNYDKTAFIQKLRQQAEHADQHEKAKLLKICQEAETSQISVEELEKRVSKMITRSPFGR